MRTGQIHKLTAKKVQTASDGRYSDGGGLFFEVRNTSKRFFFRFTWQGKKKDFPVGTFPATTLAQARGIAAGHRDTLAEGKDPRREKVIGGSTVRALLSEFLDLNESQWKNAKHRQQWTNTLEQHAGPILDSEAADVTTADVVAVLRPIWASKHETASRVRQRLERVLNYAIAMGQAQPPNPALWGGNLEFALPTIKKKVKHHAAAKLDDVAAIYAALKAKRGTSASALRFCILTACRSGEARFLEWADIEGDVISIPEERMKMAKPHRIPITPEVAELLDEQTRFNHLIFPSQALTPLSDMALAMSLRRVKTGITPHGFRSTFADWAGDAGYDYEIREAALAHTVGSAVSRAYRRGDNLEGRIPMLLDWEKLVTSAP